jgi:3-oxoacyl-[acyl-carrier-protein] synthase-3
MIQSRVTGTGAYLPEKILSNFDLEKMVDTNNEWIIERTGISERRIASPQEQTSDLALEASKKALKEAGLKAKDLDFIFLATTSPDQVMPSTACTLQNKLGASKDCGALDIYAACTGFVYGLSIADQMIKGGLYKNILVVGAEIISRFVDYKDRGTCILFGDGAGAFVLSANSESDSSSKILGHTLKADGSLGHLLTLNLGGSKYPGSVEALEQGHQYVSMEGREIFKNATRVMASCCEDVLKQTDFSPQNVDWLIPHQANVRIIESVAKRFDFPMDKVVLNIEKTGNNSSATVPIAMDLAIRDGRIKRDQHVMLTAFGGGLTSGSLLMRY